METSNGSIGQVTVTMRDGAPGAPTTGCALVDFEQSEHGAVLGRRVIPWARVARVSWGLPPRDADGELSHATVQVLVDDGSPDGERFLVPADRFEVLEWGVSVLVDDRADTTAGTIEQRRIVVPWHAVREYERMTGAPVDASAMPSRPDA